MKLPKFNQLGITHIIAPVAFIAVFAVIGSIVLLKSNAASLPCIAKTYATGSTSHCVGYIQKMLNGIDHYYNGKTKNGATINGSQITVDSSFGPQTEGKVKTFQKWNYLKNDGIVGPQTWFWLCSYAHSHVFNYSSAPAVERTAFQAGVDAGCTNSP